MLAALRESVSLHVGSALSARAGARATAPDALPIESPLPLRSPWILGATACALAVAAFVTVLHLVPRRSAPVGVGVGVSATAAPIALSAEAAPLPSPEASTIPPAPPVAPVAGNAAPAVSPSQHPRATTVARIAPSTPPPYARAADPLASRR
jgi:hypothetical protein